MFGYGFFDPSILILIPAMLFVMFAQTMVKSNFAKFSRVKSGTGLTGAQAARRMLDQNGLTDVKINAVAGSLTDHYDPRTRTVNLSEDVCNVDSVSAVGVACHECGHALQHAHNYFPLVFRNTIVPIVNTASSFSWILVMIGIMLMFASETGTSSIGSLLLNIGIIAFLTVILFHVVTLPVEINASRRAVKQVDEMGLVAPENKGGVKAVLRSAAMTYIGAVAMSLANLLRILILTRGRR